MDFRPLLFSDFAILVHATTAMLALALGTVVLLMRKGTRMHKLLGRIWVGTMAVVALSSFFISELEMWGPYSWIHILSIITLVAMVQSIAAIRRGNVKAHRQGMVALYVGALLIAGGFTLMPGRRMNEVLFADGGWSALILATAVALAIAAMVAWRRRGRLHRAA